MVRTARARAGLEPAGSCSTMGKGKGRAKGAASADRKTTAWHMFARTDDKVCRCSPLAAQAGSWAAAALQEREPDGGGP